MLPLFFSAVMLSAGLAADYSQFPWHTDFLLCLPRRCQLFPAWAVVTVTCADACLFGYQTCLDQAEEHFPKGFANTQGVLGYRHWLPTRQPHTSFLRTKSTPKLSLLATDGASVPLNAYHFANQQSSQREGSWEANCQLPVQSTNVLGQKTLLGYGKQFYSIGMKLSHAEVASNMWIHFIAFVCSSFRFQQS